VKTPITENLIKNSAKAKANYSNSKFLEASKKIAEEASKNWF
tara:strand:+ start:508 stop:633 length:126 start_codon:yes stop_codon:yes gene_type:complete